jgi:exodeoxyribonuclease V alpha subunit
MIGLAQKLFLEQTSKNISDESRKNIRWPFLEKMVAANRLGYVDLAMANQLLNNDAALEASAALICHLSLAAQRGHVCIKIENGYIKPSPEEIWIGDEEDTTGELVFDDFAFLKKLILQGSREYHSTLITKIENGVNKICTPIIQHKNAFYLHRFWCLETYFLNGIKQRFTENSLTLSHDLGLLEKKIKTLIAENKLLKEQADAILIAARAQLALITGGPGTGKTYTAGLLLRLLWETLDDEKKACFEIALAAPTGKAAANLQASIKKALNGIEGFPSLSAKTLHHLLGIRKNRFAQNLPILTADLILVDESSMIDIKLMGQLFNALKPGAKLILLGDRHQLPPVEAGSLFADLVNYFQSQSGAVVELKKCLRAELKGIINVADQIKAGNYEGALQLLDEKSAGISLVKLDQGFKAGDFQNQLLNYVIPYFPIFTELSENPLDLLEKFNRFRILTPMRKGPFGVEALNERIYQAMKSKMAFNRCFIAPIMVTQSNSRENLFNGEVGLLVKENEREFALFPARESDRSVRKIPVILMPPYEYAYCLSVYKSQGSEFEHVVLLLTDGMQSFGKEALYTGVTRAKKRLEIWGNPQILREMIQISAGRQSGVTDRLCSS